MIVGPAPAAPGKPVAAADGAVVAVGVVESSGGGPIVGPGPAVHPLAEQSIMIEQTEPEHAFVTGGLLFCCARCVTVQRPLVAH